MVLLIANKKLPSQEVILISVGIDVVKGKSTVCILKPYEKIVSKPFDISHVEKDLGELAAMLLRFDDEVKVVMEATGIYHLPVLTYLQEKGLFVAVINPYLMKVYRSGDLRMLDGELRET